MTILAAIDSGDHDTLIASVLAAVFITAWARLISRGDP